MIGRFLECGDPHYGFARIYCDGCGHDYLLAFSCKTRYYCPSCHQKRVIAYGERVEDNVLAPVAHRQYVFTLPRLLWPIIAISRAWLGELYRIAARLLERAYAEALPGGRPGLVLFVQTFGDLVNFHPHVHVLAADGAFRADSAFVELPAVPEELLSAAFRSEVLKVLVAERAVSEQLAQDMLGWQHSGFSVHNRVRVAKDDAEGRKQLARTMLRAPLSLAKMTYDAKSGTVLYRSKMHAGLKRNFQVMAGAEWLELLCRHIPDRYEHLVRYVGWYANRSRGERAKRAASNTVAAVVENLSEFALRAKAAWARLMRKVYEVDPLECPRCKGPMRVIALIEEPEADPQHPHAPGAVGAPAPAR